MINGSYSYNPCHPHRFLLIFMAGITFRR